MITKYRIKPYLNKAEIEEVEVIRETKQSVFLPSGSMRRKQSEIEEYYDTWEAAHAALTIKAERQVAAARRALESANAFAGNVKGMRKPEKENSK